MEHILSTESAGRKVWVVKVPPFVAAKWRGVCDKSAKQEAEIGEKLGTIKYTADGKAGGQPKFELVLDNPATAGLPQQYDMQAITQTAPPMLAFSEEGGRSAAEGVVQHRFDIEPAHGKPGEGAVGTGLKLDQAYKNLSKAQNQAAGVKVRKIQIMTEHKITNIRHPVGLQELGEASRRKEPTEKRVAKPAEELQADLFRLFERQRHWNFVQLQKQTEQPVQHLKTVLSEIAIQNKRGPYKDLWELKKEFKTSGGGQN